MVESILSKLSSFIILIIYSTNYFGIIFLMILESTGIPVPSEITMPFAGFLVAQGKLNFWNVVLAGVLGNWIGSLIFYKIGIKIRSASIGWQKFKHLFDSEISSGDRWFGKYGNWAGFLSRLLPIARTYISLPAGFFRLNFLMFNVSALTASFTWSTFLTYVGFYLGSNWQSVEVYFKKFDFVILSAIIIGIIYIAREVYKKIKHYREISAEINIYE